MYVSPVFKENLTTLLENSVDIWIDLYWLKLQNIMWCDMILRAHPIEVTQTMQALTFTLHTDWPKFAVLDTKFIRETQAIESKLKSKLHWVTQPWIFIHKIKWNENPWRNVGHGLTKG